MPHCKKTATAQMVHLFFFDTQTNAKNPKSHFLPTHGQTDDNISIVFYTEIRDVKNEKTTFAKKLFRHMNRIKEVLEEKGIKQTWLAEQLNKRYYVVNGCMQNRQQPRLEVLFEIAETLNVSVKNLPKED